MANDSGVTKTEEALQAVYAQPAKAVPDKVFPHFDKRSRQLPWRSGCEL
jgi:hypothetical protein